MINQNYNLLIEKPKKEILWGQVAPDSWACKKPICSKPTYDDKQQLSAVEQKKLKGIISILWFLRWKPQIV